MRGILWIVVAMGLLASGCFETPQQVLDDIACHHLCNCLVVPDCQATCLQFIAPVSDECFELASGHAQDCSMLQESIDTGGVCRPEMPDPGPE